MRKVVEPGAASTTAGQGDRPAPSYSAEHVSAKVRSVKTSSASAKTTFEAAVERHLREVAQSETPESDPAALRERVTFPGAGPDRGRLGGSGPREFNSSLTNDGVASLEEVWVGSTWRQAQGPAEAPERFGSEPVGYDGARLAAAAQDRYAAAQNATFT